MSLAPPPSCIARDRVDGLDLSDSPYYIVTIGVLVFTPGKSKEAERKRINKELANIRSKFKGEWTPCSKVGIGATEWSPCSEVGIGATEWSPCSEVGIGATEWTPCSEVGIGATEWTPCSEVGIGATEWTPCSEVGIGATEWSPCSEVGIGECHCH